MSENLNLEEDIYFKYPSGKCRKINSDALKGSEYLSSIPSDENSEKNPIELKSGTDVNLDIIFNYLESCYKNGEADSPSAPADPKKSIEQVLGNEMKLFKYFIDSDIKENIVRCTLILTLADKFLIKKNDSFTFTDKIAFIYAKHLQSLNLETLKEYIKYSKTKLEENDI